MENNLQELIVAFSHLETKEKLKEITINFKENLKLFMDIKQMLNSETQEITNIKNLDINTENFEIDDYCNIIYSYLKIYEDVCADIMSKLIETE